MKTCSKCKKIKALSEFGKDSSTSTGLKYRCKECLAAEGRERRSGNFIPTQIYIRVGDPSATCRICGIEKAIEEFSKANTPSGYLRICKRCRADDSQRRRDLDPRPAKNRNLRSNYGLSIEEWESMLLGQDKRCAVCETDQFGRRGPFVDHDHGCCSGRKSCGQCLRGIVCHHCNIAIGQIESGGWIIEIPQITRYLEVYSHAIQDRKDGQRLLCRQAT